MLHDTIRLQIEIAQQHWSLRTTGNRTAAKMQEAKAATALLEASDALQELHILAPKELQELLRGPIAGHNCPMSQFVYGWFDEETMKPLSNTYDLVCQYDQDPDLARARLNRADDQTAYARDKDSSDLTDGGQAQSNAAHHHGMEFVQNYSICIISQMISRCSCAPD